MQCDFSVILLTCKRLELLKSCLASIGHLENPAKLSFEVLICVNGDDQDFDHLHSTILFQKLLCQPYIWLLLQQVNCYLSLETHSFDYLNNQNYEFLSLSSSLPVGEARNKLIKKAKGKFLLFIDDDVELPKNYLLHACAELIGDKTDIFGGPDQSVKSRNHFQYVLNNLMKSYFCMGPTKYRHVETSTQVVADEKSLILCNLWIRGTIFETYSFPKEYVRNEENLLMSQLKIDGYKFKYINHLLVYHHRKKNLAKLARATFYSGRYRFISILEKPQSLEPIFLVPLLALIFMIIVALISGKLFLLLVSIYLIIVSFKTLLLNNKNWT